MFSDSKIRGIVAAKIEADEALGEQVGGSGHLAYVRYDIDKISKPKKVETEEETVWEITYAYTISVETEFTYSPDNPPHEYKYQKTIVIDAEGKIIRESKKEVKGSNIDLTGFSPLKKTRKPDKRHT